MTAYPDNTPILYRNIMDGLPSQFEQDVFLWAVERPNEDPMCYRAEHLAREAGRIVTNIFPMLAMNGRGLKGEGLHDLQHFILTRWANWRLGGNVKFPAALIGDAP